MNSPPKPAAAGILFLEAIVGLIALGVCVVIVQRVAGKRMRWPWFLISVFIVLVVVDVFIYPLIVQR